MINPHMKGEVSWFLSLKSKKPFGYSSVASSELIVLLYEQYGDLRLVYKNLYYDEDAKNIVKYYLDKGIYTVNIR